MSTKVRTAEPLAVGKGVLVVSDDREVAGIWAFALRQMGLQTILAHSAAEAVSQWSQHAFDLILVDVCGPRLDGIGLVRRLRAEAVNPILLLTAEHQEGQILQAYEAGVDECVVKPVSPSMFLAKVRAWLRRSWTVPTQALDPLEVGPLRLDPATRQVTVGGSHLVRLTNLEFRLLHLLMSHPGQVLPSEVIIDRVWGYGGEGDTTLLKNLAYRLRQKVEPDPGRPLHIQTAAGQGYVFPGS
jgi:DNA-binding response OmpR family regulator